MQTIYTRAFARVFAAPLDTLFSRPEDRVICDNIFSIKRRARFPGVVENQFLRSSRCSRQKSIFYKFPEMRSTAVKSVMRW